MLNLQEGFSLRIIETPASIESIPALCVEGAMTSQMTSASHDVLSHSLANINPTSNVAWIKQNRKFLTCFCPS